MRRIARFDRSSVHRLMLIWSFEGGVEFVCLDWGSRHADPVWSLGIEFTLPEWVHRWLDRRWARRHACSGPGPDGHPLDGPRPLA